MNYDVHIELDNGDLYSVTEAEYFIGIRDDGSENNEVDTEPDDLFALIQADFYEWWRLAATAIRENDMVKALEAEAEPWKNADDVKTFRSEVYFPNYAIERFYVVEDDG